MLRKLGTFVGGLAVPSLAVRPARPFARKIPETMQQVVDYKTPVVRIPRWEEFDYQDKLTMAKRLRFQFTESRKYHRLQNLWKNNLIRKQKRRERRLQRLADRVATPGGPTKLAVHHPTVARITVNEAVKRDSFAVICLNGRQYKVVADDVLLVHQLKNLNVGDIVESDKVLLVGTKDFTLLGRPAVEGARVIMSVESQTKSEKVIVFKKKRRKGFRRSFGHRSLQTFLRVLKVEFDVSADAAQRAVGIWTAPQMG